MNEYHNQIGLSSAVMESIPCHVIHEPLKAEKMDTRVNITITSYRYGKHDTDGICAKAAIDGIVKEGILTDDSAKEVKKVCFESRQAESKAMERTTIEIYHDWER